MEVTFDVWWNENKNSETLYDIYLECCDDLRDVGQTPPPFKQWAREYFNKEVKNG